MEVLRQPAPARGGGHVLLACRARLSLCRKIVASGGCGRTASLCCHPLVAGGRVWGPWRDILVMLALDYCSSPRQFSLSPARMAYPEKKTIVTICTFWLHHIKSKDATLTTGFTIQTTCTCWCSLSMDTCTSRRFTRYTSSAPTMRTLLTASVYKPLEPPVQSIKMQFTSSTWNMNCQVWKEEGNKCEAQLFQVKHK